MTEAQIKFMVDRFLAWRLPEPWHPDNGISYQRPSYHPDMTPEAVRQHYPVGTNLFDAGQATDMVRHMVEGHAQSFRNELGNTISLEVSEREIEGFPGIFIRIVGPTSETENLITRQEAIKLYESLRKALFAPSGIDARHILARKAIPEAVPKALVDKIRGREIKEEKANADAAA